MRKQHLLLLIIIAAFSVANAGCSNFDIKPSKNIITRSYKIDSQFNKLNISVVGDVYYTQSTDGSCSVSAYGPDNIIDLFTVTNDEGTLRMDMPRKTKRQGNVKVKILISSPELYAINTNGVGDINIENGLETNTFSIDSNGVGDINVNNISSESITINSRGVGNININGNTTNAELHSQGVGDINASGLQAKKVEASSRGVGNINCNATEEISASTRGIGNIAYKGNPTTKNISKAGIGSIRAK